MEFWGVEVKPGQTVKCEPGEDKLIHLSQAALGEAKVKGTENVPVYVNFSNQKLIIGTLSAEKCPQFSYDVVFEKEFELSHTSKNASVYFCGYKTGVPGDEYPGEDFSDFDSGEEDIQIGETPNGTFKMMRQGGKPKSKAKEQEKKPKAVKDDENSDDDDDDDSEDSDDDKEMANAMGDSDDDDDDSDDDDEDDESSEDEDDDTPKKAASGKKRPAEVAPKTPAEKKAKLVSPAAGQKKGGKKDGQAATPQSVKKGVKTPATNDKSKQQTPKSGSTSCTSCSKSFNSENALQAHTKAKHSAGK